MEITEDKTYIIYDEGYKIGYIDHVCNCDQCIKRGEKEIFINNLDDLYLDCVKASDIIGEIIYMGNSLTEGLEKLVYYYKRKLEVNEAATNYLQEIIKIYGSKN